MRSLTIAYPNSLKFTSLFAAALLCSLVTGCAADYSSFDSAEVNAEERSKTLPSIGHEGPPDQTLGVIPSRRDAGVAHTLSEDTVEVLIIDQLSDESSQATLSQRYQSQAATMIELRERTLITYLSWSGLLMTPAAAHSLTGDHSMEVSEPEESPRSTFFIEIYAGHDRPQGEPLETILVSADLLSQRDENVECEWRGSMLEPLAAGRYWVSIIGADEQYFYWEEFALDSHRDEDETGVVSESDARQRRAVRDEEGQWRVGAVDGDEEDRARGYSLRVEGVIVP